MTKTHDMNADNRPDTSEREEDFLEGESGLMPDGSIDIYPNAEVRISRMQYSLLHLKRLYEDRGELIIDPDFQRGNVWNSRQRSELIESILMGIPLPIIYLFESIDGRKQVVDGRQRITAIIDFLNDKLRLTDLKILGNLNGFTFSRLEPKLQGIVEDYQLLAYVIQPPTAERVKYDIFDRVNRGGTTLNAQEMRNALYGGPATQVIDLVCKSQEFIDATDGGVSVKRMRDRYVALRAMAFTSLFSGEFSRSGMPARSYEYKSDIDDFLAWYMTLLNRTLSTVDDVNKMAARYIELFSRIHETMGADVFRFESRRGKRRPINMPLVETVVYLFSRLENIDDEVEFRCRFDGWKRWLDDTNLFKRSIDSSTNVAARREAVESFIASL
ncbi:MAG: DUF262 domain-containing protein [Duncaniella sp.]|nr:DUF262 domain-containing protein [Duncaniella sp.]